MTQEVILTQDELTTLCAEWQKILRLQDWEIRVSLERGFKMDRCTLGNASWLEAKKIGEIKILDHADFDPNFVTGPQNMELTLVHELLHIHFAPFDADKDTPQCTAQEQAIHAISSALVGLKRKESVGHQGENNPETIGGTN